MNLTDNKPEEFALAFAAAWNRLEKRLSNSLGAIRGISFAEYRLLHALQNAPKSQASRVELAYAVGLTPSGVTRALRPLEKLGLVSTVRNQRDARLAMAALTSAGQELVNDAAAVVGDSLAVMLKGSPKVSAKLESMIELLEGLGR